MAVKLWLIVVAAALGACSKAPVPPPATTAPASAPAQAAPAAATAVVAHADAGIAWHNGDVDGAFAAAKAAHKPLFLYWGATWCPPCNQVKATLFNRQDFIDRSRHFIPVYIAADVLAEAGLLEASDALLTAELTRSHSPYYYMLGLAANAKKRGDNAAALDWHARAWTAATGAATRLQWGASYLNALVELAPQDSGRIESVAARVIGELDATPDTFYDRNPRAQERIGKRLDVWNKGGNHNEVLQRLAAQLGSVCAKLPAGDPARATCGAVLRARPSTAA